MISFPIRLNTRDNLDIREGEFGRSNSSGSEPFDISIGKNETKMKTLLTEQFWKEKEKDDDVKSAMGVEDTPKIKSRSQNPAKRS